MSIATVASGRTIPEVQHFAAHVNDTMLHYVAAGIDGSPILLVHGFPESWWAFHRLIPLLAQRHRVFAVDLRGFGDSAVADDDFTSATAAADLHELIGALEVGPVHLAGQDIAGGALYRLATEHPSDIRSLIATEMGLAGFGLEALGDITHGGSWHIGALVAPGIPQTLFAGRERELLGTWAFPSMTVVPNSIGDGDVDEFSRGLSRPNGWNGAIGLYRSMLSEGADFQARAMTPLCLPALAVGGFGGAFTADTLAKIISGRIDAVEIQNVGHYVALEAPRRLATALGEFLAKVDLATPPYRR
ncbi:alpha/beta fold hydrolase [Plantibacter sp. YIM 135347]|uniref:alpha/beta fold hydrolase n=1 Tax=Plantibacter sp. YIM 135347 TaxID=3423919 RepID=UPI003D3486D4